MANGRIPDLSIPREDLVMQTFRAGGPGGQHQNKRDTAVRFIHPKSGARGESREYKSQAQNRKAALERLTKDPRFRVWLRLEFMEMDSGKTAEQRVAEQMTDDKIKVEVKQDGRWVDAVD